LAGKTGEGRPPPLRMRKKKDFSYHLEKKKGGYLSQKRNNKKRGTLPGERKNTWAEEGEERKAWAGRPPGQRGKEGQPNSGKKKKKEAGPRPQGASCRKKGGKEVWKVL